MKRGSKRSRRPLILGALWLAAAVPSLSHAATYYVTPTGNDSATGASRETPWATLQHAADTVKPGDNVIVAAGTYTAGFDIRAGGSVDARITFSAEPGAIITGKNPKTADAINIEGANAVTVDGFKIQNPEGSIARSGIRSVNCSDTVIRNNKIDQAGTWGIFTGFSEKVTIEGNESSRNNTNAKESKWNHHGIYVSNSADDPVIRNNVVWGNVGNGIHVNGDVEQGGDGIISRAKIEGNVIYDNGTQGGSAINCDGVQDSTITNNLLYNNHSNGISLYKISSAQGAKNNVVANNTIVMAADSRWALNIQNGSTGNVVFNNALFTGHGYRGSLTISPDSLKGFACDYNLVMDRFTTTDGDTRMTLKDWRSSSGQDRHSVIAKPADLFENPGNNDYHLKSGSAGIDRGAKELASHAAPTVDRDGKPRPQGAGWDIGAYETPPSR